MGRKSIIPELEAKIGKPFKVYLAESIKENKTPEEIASKIGISTSACYNYINLYGLKDKLKEARRLASVGVKEGEIHDLIEEYISWKKRSGLTETTINNTIQFFKQFTWWLDYAGIPADVVHVAKDPNTAAKFLDYCREVTPRFGGINPSTRRPMSERTINNYRVNIMAFLQFLQDVKVLLEEKQLKQTKLLAPKIKEGKKKLEDLPDEIIKKIFRSFDNSFEGIRSYTVILFFMDTGMRMGGVSKLKRNQFDLDTGWGIIEEKGKKERDIRLSASLLKQLKSYVAIRDKIAKTDYLWVKGDGSQYTRRAIEKFLRLLDKRFGPEVRLVRPGQTIHAHVFRHIFAKRLVEANVGIQAIADMGGWEDWELVREYAREREKKLAWDEKFEEASPYKSIMGVVNV